MPHKKRKHISDAYAQQTDFRFPARNYCLCSLNAFPTKMIMNKIVGFVITYHGIQ